MVHSSRKVLAFMILFLDNSDFSTGVSHQNAKGHSSLYFLVLSAYVPSPWKLPPQSDLFSNNIRSYLLKTALFLNIQIFPTSGELLRTRPPHSGLDGSRIGLRETVSYNFPTHHCNLITLSNMKWSLTACPKRGLLRGVISDGQDLRR